MFKKINVFTDGGSRGNPGESAIGVYILDENNRELTGFGKKIGISTNNIAEYKAVLEALTWIEANKEKLEKKSNIFFFLDSRLVCSQINGLFKVKNANLRELLFSIREKEVAIGKPILYSHIPREKNVKADELVNEALDR